MPLRLIGVVAVAIMKFVIRLLLLPGGDDDIYIVTVKSVGEQLPQSFPAHLVVGFKQPTITK